MVVKSYRGLLEDGGQDKIRLTTTDGRMGYKIIKFQVMTAAPVGAASEHVVKIFNEKQAVVSAAVDFSDPVLLAVNVWTNAVGYGFEGTMGVIFDGHIFNQDIYITQSEETGNAAANYYIELEQLKLTAIQAEVLIVKDLRKQPWTRP